MIDDETDSNREMLNAVLWCCRITCLIPSIELDIIKNWNLLFLYKKFQALKILIFIFSATHNLVLKFAIFLEVWMN